jgi:formylglycine-generating enzyme required for sulfatase activity
MKCRKCGCENPEENRFCGKCGHNLAEQAPPGGQQAVVPARTACPNPECDGLMPSEAKFCGLCGAKMRPDEPVTRPVAGEETGPSVGGELPRTPPPPEPEVDEDLQVSQMAEVPKSDATAERVAVSEKDEGSEEEVVAPARDTSQEGGTGGDETVERAEEADRLEEITVEVVEPDEYREAESTFKSPVGSLRAMVLIPDGWFAMGSPMDSGEPDERPRHQVELTAYFIDRYAVSNLDYEKFDPRHRRKRPEIAEGDNDPVVFVTYQDCLDYCRWRAEQEGVPAGTYTLPSEAQWERAARGGYPGRSYPWGNEITAELCNTADTGRGRAVPVNAGQPNGFGLFHMGSNVREWCRDYYSEDYYSTAEAAGPDPVCATRRTLAQMRVVRGASFADLAERQGRCAARHCAHPSSSSNDMGFRCVRKYVP